MEKVRMSEMSNISALSSFSLTHTPNDHKHASTAATVAVGLQTMCVMRREVVTVYSKGVECER